MSPKFVRRFAALIAALAASLGFSLLSAGPAQAEGGRYYSVNVDAACREQNGEDPLVKSEAEDWRNPYTWRCIRKTGSTDGGLSFSVPFSLGASTSSNTYEIIGEVDMQRACSIQHSDTIARVRTLPGAGESAYDWVCWWG